MEQETQMQVERLDRLDQENSWIKRSARLTKVMLASMGPLLKFGLSAIAFGVVLLALMQSDAAAKSISAKTFSNASLSGGYSGLVTGLEWFTPAGGSPTKLDVTSTQLTQYDGQGNLTGHLTIVAAVTFGASPQATCTADLTGTYSVNPDGTGTSNFSITVTSGPCIDNVGTNSFVIGNSGQVINGQLTSVAISPSAGVIDSFLLSGTSIKQ